MKAVTLTIQLDDHGMWRAKGNYLGHDLATASTSLWDCLELCKQRVWDAEIAFDASSGLLMAAVHESERDAAYKAAEEELLVRVDANAAGERAVHRLESTPVGRPSADVLRLARLAVMLSEEASIAFIQRHLRIGYGLAVAVMEALVAEKTVSDTLENGRRRVLRSFPTQGP